MHVRALELAARRLCRTRSVVLGGHGVADVPPADDPEHLCVAPGRFRAQLELLLGAGFAFVTVSELVDAGRGSAPPPGLAALSFDDGMHDNLTVVLPLLREYGIPATVYVATGLSGRPNPWIDPRAGMRMLTRDEVVELADGGVEIGAHTVSHPDLATLDADRCHREVADGKHDLEALLGRPVRSFAYPYFRSGGHAVAAVRAAGFDSAVVGARRGPWSPLEVPRAMVTGVDGVPSVLAKAAGCYEPLFASRAGAAARRLTRRPRLALRAVRGRGAA